MRTNGFTETKNVVALLICGDLDRHSAGQQEPDRDRKLYEYADDRSEEFRA
jgi:hypothetical protein